MGAPAWKVVSSTGPEDDPDLEGLFDDPSSDPELADLFDAPSNDNAAGLPVAEPKVVQLPVVEIEGDPDAPYGGTGAPRISEREALDRGMADVASFSRADSAHGFGAAMRALAEKVGTTKLTDPVLRYFGADIPESMPYERAETRGMGAPQDRSALQTLAAHAGDVGRTFSDAREGWRAEDRLAAEDQPGHFLAGQVGAGLGTAALPLGPGAWGSTALRRLAGMSAGGAIAGGLQASGETEADDIMGSTRDTLKGGVVGAVAAPIVGGAAMMAGAGAKALPKAAGWAADTWTDWGARVHGKTMPDDLAAAGRRMAANTPEGKALRADMLAGEEGARVSELAGELTNLQKAVDPVRDYANISMKPDVVRDAMARDWAQLVQAHGGNKGVSFAQQESAFEALKSARDALGFLKTYHNGAGAARKLERILAEVQPQFASSARRTGPEAAADMYIAIDKLKRGVGELLQSNDQTIHAVGKELYEPMRSTLENPGVWGATSASKQQIVNKAYTDAITAERAGFGRSFLTESPIQRTTDNTRNLMVADPAKVGPFMRGLGTQEVSGPGGRAELLEAGVRTQANLADTLAREYQAPPDITQAAQRGKQFAGNLQSLMQLAEREATAARTMKELEQQAAQQSGLMGKVRGVLPHPAATGRVRATLEREQGRRAAQVPAQGMAPPSRASAMQQLAARGASMASVPNAAPAMAAPPTDDTYNDSMGHEAEKKARAMLQQDPQAFGEHSQKLLDAMNSGDADAFAAALYSASRKQDFRTQYLPMLQGTR